MSLHQNTGTSAPKVRYDPTINLGHILTFIGFIVALATAWFNIDKRILVLEQATARQTIIDASQDSERRIIQIHTNEVVQDIKATLTRIENKVDKR
jgi:hypothetical protein